jgi:predicted small secreted protein
MKKLALLAVRCCNTIAGVGEDVSAGARTVQDTIAGVGPRTSEHCGHRRAHGAESVTF